MKYIHDIDSLSIRIIDLEAGFNYVIEKEVEEDNHKFRLDGRPSLIKKFIAYRLCNYLINTIQNSKDDKKIVFYYNEKIELEFLQAYSSYIRLLTQRLSKILSFTIFYNVLSVNSLVNLVQTATGEGKELKHKMLALTYRNKQIPDISKFNKFLEKNGIHRLDNNPIENYKIRLGLFIA